ncbi:amidase [Pleionea sediminis]|uniref:amidase n=1 Tax=Pleionea sediminis TaxID=2569479 RepID=UPI0013DDFF44|nr:amidase [Pleionea sediminis]
MSLTSLLRLCYLFITITIIASCTHHKTSDNKTSKLELWTQSETILQLQERMKQNEFTSVELTQFYLDKIKSQDNKFNSVIAINNDAIKTAQQLDKERQLGKVRSPLHGIPVAVKDNIETLDMPTTAGSLALENNVTKRDATFIKNLRDAGAIIIAKTNLSEWANIRSERSSSGWSAIGGQTKNPTDVTRSPCGSSSGSGAVIVANFAIAAIGTETNGSITCPASVTGVVGVKPSVGLVSRFRVIPISHTQDTAGPMAKNVTDATILLHYMSSEDPKDPFTINKDIERNQELVTLENPSFSFKELRLGVVNSSASDHEAVKALEDSLLQRLQELEVSLKLNMQHTPYEGFWADTYSVLLFEFKHNINEYLKSLPNSLNSLTLEKLIEFNIDNKEQEMKYFQQEIFEKAQDKGPISSKSYLTALEKIRKETQASINNKINHNKLDALIAITRGPAWKIDKVNGDHVVGGVSTYSAVSGFPHITIPLGKIYGLPIGLSIMGTDYSESKLLKIAYQIEQELKRKPLKEIN